MVVTITALQDLLGRGVYKRGGARKVFKNTAGKEGRLQPAPHVALYSLSKTLHLHVYMSHIGLLPRHILLQDFWSGLQLKKRYERYVAGELVTKQNKLQTFTLCRFV